MVKLFRCEICGDPYIGEEAPSCCPFCGAHINYIKESRAASAVFDLQLASKDRANAEKALSVEISNASFYACASDKSNTLEGRLLFKALAKVEGEHASVWKKILSLGSVPKKEETCVESLQDNLRESHARETRAIEFYKNAASQAVHDRIRQIFEAFTEVERDHLSLADALLEDK